MRDNSSVEALQVRNELRILSVHLYRGIEHGIEIAREFFSADGREYDPHLFPHIVRFGALEKLPRGLHSVQGEFLVDGKPMSGIEIQYRHWIIRVFKKPNAKDEFLQPAGESPTRQDFYQQRVLPGSEHLFRGNLVYVWDRLGSGGVDLWLVRPFGFDSIWKHGNCKWSIPIEHPANQIVPSAAFADLEDEPLDLQLDETVSEDDPKGGA